MFYMSPVHISVHCSPSQCVNTRLQMWLWLWKGGLACIRYFRYNFFLQQKRESIIYLSFWTSGKYNYWYWNRIIHSYHEEILAAPMWGLIGHKMWVADCTDYSKEDCAWIWHQHKFKTKIIKATLVVYMLKVIKHSPSPPPLPTSFISLIFNIWPLYIWDEKTPNNSGSQLATGDLQCLAELSWLLHPLIHTWHCRNTYFVIHSSVGLWCTSQYSLVQYNTVQYKAVNCRAVQYFAVQ